MAPIGIEFESEDIDLNGKKFNVEPGNDINLPITQPIIRTLNVFCRVDDKGGRIRVGSQIPSIDKWGTKEDPRWSPSKLATFETELNKNERATVNLGHGVKAKVEHRENSS